MIHRERLLALTQKVISINSENPPGNEEGIARFVARDMKSLGLKVKTYTFFRRRPNIVAVLEGRFSPRKKNRKSILLTPHIDTVPIGKGWKQDPLGGKIINGKIYGRGASDDKGNLACCLEVMRSLVEDRVRLPFDLIMAATVDEETGSRHGIIPLLERKILRPEVAVILDSDDFNAVIAQKGLIHCRVQIFGKKAHAAYNWRGVNAIEIASQVICALKKHKFSFKAHSLLRPPTMNVGIIKGGDKVNMVADFCEFSLDVRFLPGTSAAHVLSEVRAVIRRHAKKFRIEIDDIQKPYEISREQKAVKTYLDAAKAMNIPAKVKASEGATVITFFKKHKIPAFATGYGAHGNAHTTDEYACVDTLYQGARLLERFVKEYTSIKE